jgi:hypothetical protein
MSDVTCSQCGEPWEVYGLRHDAIGYFDTYQGDVLEPLESVPEVIAYLAAHGGDSDRDLAERVAGLDLDGAEPTLPVLFAYWWNTKLDTSDAGMVAAKRIVDTAIHHAVLLGKGCPSCEFEHTGRGAHRETTEYELAFSGITDEDPAEYLY